MEVTPMNKRSFKQKTLLGIIAGCLAANPLLAADATATKPAAKTADDPNAGNLGYHLLTEDELMLDLNDEGAKLYQSLTPEGKALAREVASTRCNGSNQCAGLNACASDKNKCLGLGSCKGQSKCAISDKNLAVKLVAKKMADKREKTLKP